MLKCILKEKSKRLSHMISHYHKIHVMIFNKIISIWYLVQWIHTEGKSIHPGEGLQRGMSVTGKLGMEWNPLELSLGNICISSILLRKKHLLTFIKTVPSIFSLVTFILHWNKMILTFNGQSILSYSDHSR